MDGHPSVMNGAEFAKLVERSEMMISKYRAAGYLVTDADDKILPLESLHALEGRGHLRHGFRIGFGEPGHGRILGLKARGASRIFRCRLCPRSWV